MDKINVGVVDMQRTGVCLIKRHAPGEDRTHDLQISKPFWLWDWRAAYCATEAMGNAALFCLAVAVNVSDAKYVIMYSTRQLCGVCVLWLNGKYVIMENKKWLCGEQNVWRHEERRVCSAFSRIEKKRCDLDVIRTRSLLISKHWYRAGVRRATVAPRSQPLSPTIILSCDQITCIGRVYWPTGGAARRQWKQVSAESSWWCSQDGRAV